MLTVISEVEWNTWARPSLSVETLLLDVTYRSDIGSWRTVKALAVSASDVVGIQPVRHKKKYLDVYDSINQNPICQILLLNYKLN